MLIWQRAANCSMGVVSFQLLCNEHHILLGCAVVPRAPLVVVYFLIRLYTNTSITITVYSHVLYTITWGTQANDCIAGISNSVGKYKYSFQT